ncbi:hypothetical protein AVEN_99399-1 [Araneus ventricosus]|uniref:Uncharacterized protein n=1 Tax=Araneus ventricosus TaxID=182803 RepID=A0A4Y2JM02_ARAVE|nr:hypothetical protein AVEN_99399-1 [Araneus ventricosus]
MVTQQLAVDLMSQGHMRTVISAREHCPPQYAGNNDGYFLHPVQPWVTLVGNATCSIEGHFKSSGAKTYQSVCISCMLIAGHNDGYFVFPVRLWVTLGNSATCSYEGRFNGSGTMYARSLAALSQIILSSKF